MTNPYLIEAPALISFSGGRTSAHLLKQIIDAYGSELPADIGAGGSTAQLGNDKRGKSC